MATSTKCQLTVTVLPRHRRLQAVTAIRALIILPRPGAVEAITIVVEADITLEVAGGTIMVLNLQFIMSTLHSHILLIQLPHTVALTTLHLAPTLPIRPNGDRIQVMDRRNMFSIKCMPPFPFHLLTIILTTHHNLTHLPNIRRRHLMANCSSLLHHIKASLPQAHLSGMPRHIPSKRRMET